MADNTLLTLGGLGVAFYAALHGAFGAQAQTMAGELVSKASPTVSKALGKASPILPGPTPQEVASGLGVSLYVVLQGMKQTGKTAGQLTLADLKGIPEAPAAVGVTSTGQVVPVGTPGSVTSNPNPQGPPASWANPTGGSTTWGGLTGAQIQAAYVAAAGGNVQQAQANWQKDHAAQVAQNGF